MHALLLPGTPLLIAGIDGGEPAEMTRLRTAALQSLAPQVRLLSSGLAGLPAAGLPAVLGFGGLGIDAGVRLIPDHAAVDGEPTAGAGGACGSAVDGEPTAGAGGACGSAVGVQRRGGACEALSVRPVAVSGAAYRQACRELDGEQAQLAARVPVATITALMLAAAAGSRVHLGPVPSGSAQATAAQILVPVDFSAAAHPAAPLAQIPGAADFDDRICHELRGGDAAAREALLGQAALADRFAADLHHLGALLDSGAAPSWTLQPLDATDVHHVRYRLAALHLPAAEPHLEQASPATASGAGQVNPAAASGTRQESPAAASDAAARVPAGQRR